jgi:hypothetical protein
MLGGAYYTDCDAIKKMSEHIANKKLIRVKLFLHLPNDVKPLNGCSSVWSSATGLSVFSK